MSADCSTIMGTNHQLIQCYSEFTCVSLDIRSNIHCFNIDKRDIRLWVVLLWYWLLFICCLCVLHVFVCFVI